MSNRDTELFAELDQAFASYELEVAIDPHPLLPPPPGLLLTPSRSMETFYQDRELRHQAFEQLQADLKRAGYRGFSSGREQAVFEHPETGLLYKVPNIWESCPSNGVCSMVCSAVSARYSGPEHSYAAGARSRLFWHHSGYPILVQERLENLFGWRNRAPSSLKLPAPLSELVQVGWSSVQQRHVVYDYDGMPALSGEWPSAVEDVYYRCISSISEQQMVV